MNFGLTNTHTTMKILDIVIIDSPSNKIYGWENYKIIGFEKNKAVIQKLKFNGNGRIRKVAIDKLKPSPDADKFTYKHSWTHDGKATRRLLSW